MGLDSWCELKLLVQGWNPGIRLNCYDSKSNFLVLVW
jgi:hypothetical protein